MMYLYKKKNW